MLLHINRAVDATPAWNELQEAFMASERSAHESRGETISSEASTRDPDSSRVIRVQFGMKKIVGQGARKRLVSPFIQRTGYGDGNGMLSAMSALLVVVAVIVC